MITILQLLLVYVLLTSVLLLSHPLNCTPTNNTTNSTPEMPAHDIVQTVYILYACLYLRCVQCTPASSPWSQLDDTTPTPGLEHCNSVFSVPVQSSWLRKMGPVP